MSDFREFVFQSGRFAPVLRGARDLTDLLAEWLDHIGSDFSCDVLLSYWFEKGDNPDQDMIAHVEALPHRQIIATNNEAHRAAFIRERSGWGERMEAIFAAGPMGVAKPDDGFFHRIREWSELAPQEILLVDDSADNIKAAQALGWQGFHFTDATRGELIARLTG